jgi:hypothetical protein
MTQEQQPLFDERVSNAQVPLDTSKAAEAISEAARLVEYVDRTSEAARDQGHGPVNTPAVPTEIVAPPDPDRKFYPASKPNAEEEAAAVSGLARARGSLKVGRSGV